MRKESGGKGLEKNLRIQANSSKEGKEEGERLKHCLPSHSAKTAARGEKARGRGLGRKEQDGVGTVI